MMINKKTREELVEEIYHLRAEIQRLTAYQKFSKAAEQKPKNKSILKRFFEWIGISTGK